VELRGRAADAAKNSKGRRRVENIGDGLSHMGMIRNPRSMWPFVLNKWLAGL